MCGVIVVDACRSGSTNLGRDSYIMIIAGYRHDYLKFYQLPNSNLFTHRFLFFSGEATTETYCPWVSFSYYLLSRSILLAFSFSDLLNQKYKNTLLPFILFGVRSINIYFIWWVVSQSFASLHFSLSMISTCASKIL